MSTVETIEALNALPPEIAVYPGSDEDDQHVYIRDTTEGCWVAYVRADCVGVEEIPLPAYVPSQPAADQTPAADSERVEEVLAEMRDCFRVERADDNVLVPVSHLRIVHDEVTRLTALLAEQAATIERVIDQGLIQPAEWLGDKRTYSDELAEEPGNDAYMAYIERVLTASGYADIPWGPVTLAITLDRLVRENEKAAALGSQRTEGQG